VVESKDPVLRFGLKIAFCAEDATKNRKKMRGVHIKSCISGFYMHILCKVIENMLD
jgi:hypothetical protein